MVGKLLLLYALFFRHDLPSPTEPLVYPKVPTVPAEAEEEHEKHKGQGLVEFALIAPVLLMLLLLAIDPFFKAVNIALGKYYTFQAAREASIFLADGTHSCDSWVRSHVSEPTLLMGTGWTLTMSPCPADPSWSQVSGSVVTATFAWQQTTVFWPGPWDGQMVTRDVFQ